MSDFWANIARVCRRVQITAPAWFCCRCVRVQTVEHRGTERTEILPFPNDPRKRAASLLHKVASDGLTRLRSEPELGRTATHTLKIRSGGVTEIFGVVGVGNPLLVTDVSDVPIHQREDTSSLTPVVLGTRVISDPQDESQITYLRGFSNM